MVLLVTSRWAPIHRQKLDALLVGHRRNLIELFPRIDDGEITAAREAQILRADPTQRRALNDVAVFGLGRGRGRRLGLFQDGFFENKTLVQEGYQDQRHAKAQHDDAGAAAALLHLARDLFLTLDAVHELDRRPIDDDGFEFGVLFFHEQRDGLALFLDRVSGDLHVAVVRLRRLDGGFLDGGFLDGGFLDRSFLGGRLLRRFSGGHDVEHHAFVIAQLAQGLVEILAGLLIHVDRTPLKKQCLSY